MKKMGEIGSFIELQFEKGKEFYRSSEGVARLNSGRAAIYHAVRVLGCRTVWLPYYQCDTVRNFLSRKGIDIRYYYIDKNFDPVDLHQDEGDAVLFVNYYGVMSDRRMRCLADGRKNVIIDNSQAFFCPPLKDCLNVYSCRKFVGVPDGAYVIGKDAERYATEYAQGYSSDTSLFLLQRIEYGCEGKAYTSRMVNEQRIDSEDIRRMSKLTHAILDGTDYNAICEKRKENFKFVSERFRNVNRLDAEKYFDEDCVPMVYPLCVEDDTLLPSLTEQKHFQGHWWSYLLKELPSSSFEYWVSRYIIPITIDQRYGADDLADLVHFIHSKI